MKPLEESQLSDAPTSGQSPKPARDFVSACQGKRWTSLVLGVAVLIYAATVISHWSQAYIDFGDGNYLYICWRLSEGATLYRDVLAPQPPMHFFVGWVLAKLASLAGLPMLYVFRGFSVLLHASMALLVASFAQRVALIGGNEKTCHTIGALAGIFYLLAPIGFWWSLGYQSEPLEILFLYGALFVLLKDRRPAAAVGAGVFAALACLTNMTAAPYACLFVLYLFARERRLCLPFLIGLCVPCVSVTLLLELKTGAYLENVIFNQVGSFPRREFLPPGQNLLTYAWGKITSEGRDILTLEGGLIVLALVGLLRLLRAAQRAPQLELFSWAALTLMASVVYVAKGGTMDYIFTIGEPIVAVLAALVVADLGEGYRALRKSSLLRNTIPLAYLTGAAGLALVVFAPGLGFIARTLRQETFELDEYRTRQVVELMQQHSAPDTEVLSPPFYAFLARRRIVADYSEIFLWTLKYYNEKQDQIHGRGVTAVEQIASALEAKKIAFVTLDLDQTGRIREIKAAIERNYRPLRESALRTLNTRLMFYVPQ